MAFPCLSLALNPFTNISIGIPQRNKCGRVSGVVPEVCLSQTKIWGASMISSS